MVMFNFRLIFLLVWPMSFGMYAELEESKFSVTVALIALTGLFVTVLVIDRVNNLRWFIFYDIELRSIVENIFLYVFMYFWFDFVSL